MKHLLTAVLLFITAFSLYPDTIKNTFSAEYTRRDFIDQTILSGIVFEDTLSWTPSEGSVLLLKGCYELKDELQKTGAGLGIVFTYFNNFYSELSYTYLLSESTPVHRLYCDSTYEDGWGYLTLSAVADFSESDDMSASIGMKNHMSPRLSLWNRYTLAFSSAEETKNAWWSEIQYQPDGITALKTGITAEWPVSSVMPDLRRVEILAGISVKPSELVYISYQAAIAQQQYSFQQRHSMVLTLYLDKE